MGKAWDLFYQEFITNKAYESALSGLVITVEIAVFGLIIGIVIGTMLAITKVVPKDKVLPKILSRISDVYIGFFRGTPMVTQLLLLYYGLLPLLNLSIDAVYVAIIVFGLNSGAYISEIMRAGIKSVDQGQLEAARAVGLGYGISMLKVVIPQAVKNILPTLGNEFITLIKETSVVSFIAIIDLTKVFQSIGDKHYEYLIPYSMLALVYLVIVIMITLLVRLLERRLAKNDRSR